MTWVAMGAGRRPSFLQTIGLDARRKMRAGANGAAEFADGSGFADPFEAFEGAAKFIVHQREFEAEGGRLGVDAVAAPDAGREFVLARLLRDGFAQRPRIGNEQVRALHHLDGKRGVNHVTAGQPEMEPAAGAVIDFFGDGGGEADDVMVERFFQFLLAHNQTGQIGEPLVGAAFHFGEVRTRHDPFPNERLAGQQFDLEPEPELVFVGPDGPHLRAGITRNHGSSLKCRESRVESRVPAKSPRPSTFASRLLYSCTSSRMASYITAPIRAGRAASGLAKGTAPSRPRAISLVPAFNQVASKRSVYTWYSLSCPPLR